MGHKAAHHIEHAEHAAHASHDRFDRQVTISIAIVAAVLAGITVLGHRAHNETLLLQGEALEELSSAGNLHITASDQWSFYQAQNIRNHEYAAFLGLIEVLAAREDADGVAKRKELKENWEKQVAKYERKLPEIMSEAKKAESVAAEHEKSSRARREESHAVHAKAARYDLAELGLQFGVVLCSLAILTKSRAFWMSGLLSGLVGLGVAVSGYLELFLSEGH